MRSRIAMYKINTDSKKFIAKFYHLPHNDICIYMMA